MSTARLTAGAPLAVLVKHLARAGWGDLAGVDAKGVRAALRALADLLPAGSASGRVTAPQIAASAGYSERWMRSRLELLEAADVITWTRGGVVAGRPVPSLIRVHKRVLLDLVLAARTIRDAVVRKAAAATRERLAGVLNTMRRTRRRGIVAGQPHAEVATGLPPNGEGSRRSPAPPPGDIRERHTIVACSHGGDARRFTSGPLTGQARCPMCRREAVVEA